MTLTKFQTSFEHWKTEKLELRLLEIEIENSIDEACEGSIPVKGKQIPHSLTIDIFYRILIESRHEYIRAYIKLAEECFKKGQRISKNNKEFFEKMKKIKSRDFREKATLRHGFGVEEFEDHPLLILTLAINHYGDMDFRCEGILAQMTV
jgi:uncharacterized protein YydD (DUF2326 family)